MAVITIVTSFVYKTVLRSTLEIPYYSLIELCGQFLNMIGMNFIINLIQLQIYINIQINYPHIGGMAACHLAHTRCEPESIATLLLESEISIRIPVIITMSQSVSFFINNKLSHMIYYRYN